MRRSRFSKEKIIGVLRELEAGAMVHDVVRGHGVSRDTVYRWRKKYGGMGARMPGG